MSGFFCILVVPNWSGDGVRRRLSRHPPRRCSASRSAVPSTARAAITAVYSGWFSTRVSCLCCGVCTESLRCPPLFVDSSNLAIDPEWKVRNFGIRGIWDVIQFLSVLYATCFNNLICSASWCRSRIVFIPYHHFPLNVRPVRRWGASIASNYSCVPHCKLHLSSWQFACAELSMGVLMLSWLSNNLLIAWLLLPSKRTSEIVLFKLFVVGYILFAIYLTEHIIQFAYYSWKWFLRCQSRKHLYVILSFFGQVYAI